MSTADLRDAFNQIALDKGVRCTSALLLYCDSKGMQNGKRDHQQLIFNCVDSNSNTTPQWVSDPLSRGANINAAAQAIARKAIGVT